MYTLFQHTESRDAVGPTTTPGEKSSGAYLMPYAFSNLSQEVNMKMAAFKDVAPCSLKETDRRFKVITAYAIRRFTHR
jgi:hypothetical protein